MSQYDFGNLESPLSGTTWFNTHCEPWRNALHSSHAGASRPSYAQSGMMWLDTNTTPWVLKIFDGTDDIAVGTVNAATNVFTPAGLILDNIVATSAPTVNEDSGDGYSAGSLWVNLTTDLAYLCVDASVGAAIWKQLVDTTSTQALSGKSFSSITVTGGSITGITDLAVADGGTGASSASAARTNLGAVNIAGDTMTGKLNTAPSASGGAGLNIGGAGAAPSSPSDGDLWITTGGAYARVNGTTKKIDSGTVVQIKRYSSGAVTTGITSVIPYDDTIPQNTEGTEWGTLAITPQSATNRLLIEVNLNYSVGTGVQAIAALFQDSTANALAAVNHNTNGNTAGGVLRMSHEMAAGTTSATTFKVRVGTYSGGTLVINGAAGARLFGGVYISSITITEFVP